MAMEKGVSSWRRGNADGGRAILLFDEQYATTQVLFGGRVKNHGYQYQIEIVARGEMTTRSYVYKKTQ